MSWTIQEMRNKLKGIGAKANGDGEVGWALTVELCFELIEEIERLQKEIQELKEEMDRIKRND